MDPAMAALLLAARRCSGSSEGLNGEGGANRVSHISAAYDWCKKMIRMVSHWKLGPPAVLWQKSSCLESPPWSDQIFPDRRSAGGREQCNLQ